jgi:hypothetical protein
LFAFDCIYLKIKGIRRLPSETLKLKGLW